MKSQRFILAALFAFTANVVFTPAEAILHELEADNPECHIETSQCPDPDCGGEPCGPSCPCACCTGHSPLAVPLAMAEVPVVGAQVRAVAAPPVDDALQSATESGIFRPPRV